MNIPMRMRPVTNRETLDNEMVAILDHVSTHFKENRLKLSKICSEL